MESVMKDVALAFRLFARNPAFAAVAVLTIALGIGANTAIFSVVRGVLLRPLPYADPDRLVMVWNELLTRNVRNFPISPPDLKDFREQSTVWEGLEGVFSFPQPLTGGDAEPEQIQVGGVTAGFHALLGVTPVLGRAFTAEDATPPPPQPDAIIQFGQGLPTMVLLSHELWQRRYGSDPEVIGRSIELGGAPATVVGVLPRGLRLYLPSAAGVSSEIDAWVAARIDFVNSPRNNVFLRVIGKLKPGVTLERAQQEMSALAIRLNEDNERLSTAGRRVNLVPLQEDLTAAVRPTVLALLGAVAFVLLIACANVSNLLLVRASAREREMAVRAALGGSRLRIARQVLVESTVLALLGGVLGVGLALLGIRVLLALQPTNLPRIETVSIDGPVLAYTALAALLAALLFGTLPALHATRTDLARSLKERGRTAGARAQSLVRGGVVVLEVALSLVLLIGAGLMLRSFATLRGVDPGFDARRVLTFSLPLPQSRYATIADRATFARQLRERLDGIAGVESVSAAFPLPLTGQQVHGPYGHEEALSNPALFRQADFRTVEPDYFATMGTRVLEGRGITEADAADSAAVAVVDATFAHKMWPGESAVGKRFVMRLFTPEPIWVEVIGVVEHQRNGPLAGEGRETVYVSNRFAGGLFLASWLVRTAGDPLALVPAVRAALAELDPLLPMSDVRPMQDYVERAMASTQFALVLIGIFGITALILASVGLYGVLSYTVRQRTMEIGVRMAFGAEGRSILGMMVGKGLRLTALGVVLGLAAAVALTRVLASMLIGVKPTDLPTYASVAALFIVVAALACYLPARRATRVDPLVALREEP
jgi:predicted permease